MRYCRGGFIFDTKGACCFSDTNLKYALGFINSKVAKCFLDLLCPTLDYSPGQLGRLPYCVDEEKTEIVEKKVKQCIEISKEDWDFSESSWNFKKHPLV